MSYSKLHNWRWLKERSVVNGECWDWTAGMHGVGYGSVPRKIHKSAYAHRAMYECVVGPIPNGLYVLHTCDNRKCVNPEHLWTGTHLDNIKDMQAKGRHRGGSMPNEMNPFAKFTDVQVEAIRERARAGVRKCEIEREFGLSETHYYRIIKREARK